MSTIEKLGLAIVGVAMVTTLVLPKRQTVGVINATGNAASTLLQSAMGTAKAR